MRIASGSVAATLLIVTASLGLANAASAAPAFATEAQVSGIQFTSSQVASGSTAQIQADWSLPDNAASPAGFTMPLPAALQGQTDSFPLNDSAGAAAGQCTVTATDITCQIDADYIAAHPLDLHGSFNFWVTVTTQVDQSTNESYTVNGQTASITVTPPATNTCQSNCDFPGRTSGKWGWYNTSTNTIEWTVVIGTGSQGMDGGLAVTVTDTPGANQRLVTTVGDSTFPVVYATNQLGPDANGYDNPLNWQTLDPSDYTVNPDGSVTFTSEQGYFYDVHFATAVTDAGQGGTRDYENGATIAIEGQSTTPVEGEVTYHGGGGTADGTAVGAFSISKHVVWPASPVAGLAFTGTYTVTSPSGAVSDGTFSVGDGQTWTSGQFAQGSTVHLAENAPSGPASLQWGQPQFSGNDFTLGGNASTTAVTLTNTAALATGEFCAHKVVTGSGAGLVAPNASFALDYTYPAGEGFPAGDGTLELPANGTVVDSAPIPVGAQVTLSEKAAAAVPGAAWTGSRLSSDTVAIDGTGCADVTVTNTITGSPTPAPAATSAAAPEQTSLASTGSSLHPWLVYPAGAALAVGLVLVIASVKRRTRS